jgi:hypothetical protein
MADERDPSERLARAGYMKWAIDPTGRSYVTPDGLRVVTFEQAIAEIDAAEQEMAA